MTATDKKLQELTAATTWSATNSDVVYLTGDPSGTPVDRKITVQDLFENIVVGVLQVMPGNTTQTFLSLKDSDSNQQFLVASDGSGDVTAGVYDSTGAENISLVGADSGVSFIRNGSLVVAGTTLTGSEKLKVVGHAIIDQDSDVLSLTIDTEATTAGGVLMDDSKQTTGHIISITNADGLTTGAMLNLESGSTDAGTRDLVHINNSSTSSINATALRVTQAAAINGILVDMDENGRSIVIESSALNITAPAIDIQTPGHTTGNVINISPGALTSGSAIKIDSTGADATARSIVNLIQNHASASSAVVLRVQQDSAANAVEVYDGASLAFAVSDGAVVGVGAAGENHNSSVNSLKVTSATIAGLFLDDSGSAGQAIGFTSSDGNLAFYSEEAAKEFVTYDAGTEAFVFTGGVTLDTGDITLTRAASGSDVTVTLTNTTSDNGASDAKLVVKATGASGGDPWINLAVGGVLDWHIGIDNSDGDKFCIGTGTAIGTNPLLVAHNTGGGVSIGTVALPSANNTAGVWLADNAADPTLTGLNIAAVYAKDNAGNMELWGSDEGGTAVKLAPHAPVSEALAAGIIFDEDDHFPEVNVSRNPYLGQVTYKYWRLDGTVQRVTAPMPDSECRDWDDDQAAAVRASVLARAKWDASPKSDEDGAAGRPKLYVPKPHPLLRPGQAKPWDLRKQRKLTEE